MIWRAERIGPGHLTADVYARMMAALKAEGIVIEDNAIKVTRGRNK